jgi:hypothetical protein
LLSWLLFVASGVGPYSASRCISAITRRRRSLRHQPLCFEAQRHFGILDARLAKQKYMLGDTYTIVDMDVWGWARMMPNVLGEGAWDKYKNLKRLVDEIMPVPRRKRPYAEGPPQVQDRDGPGSAARDVPAPEGKGRVFDINERDFVSIIGPSGCGKTTIFNIIAGLIEPDSGSMHYRGEEIESLRGRVGYMMQKDLLFPWRTVLGNVLLGSKPAASIAPRPKPRRANT